MPLTAKELAEIAVELHEGGKNLLDEAIAGQLTFEVGTGLPTTLAFGKEYYDLSTRLWYRGDVDNHPVGIAGMSAAIIASGPPTMDAQFIGQNYFDQTAGLWYRSWQIGQGPADWRFNDTFGRGRVLYLEDYYYGEDYWDDAMNRAKSQQFGGGSGNPLGPHGTIVLPHSTGGDAINFAAPVLLDLNRMLIGDGALFASILTFVDIDPAGLGCLKFVYDGAQFAHGQRLFNFSVAGYPIGVHGMYVNNKLGEQTNFDFLVFTPGNEGPGGTSDGVHFTNGSIGTTPATYGRIAGFGCRHLVHMDSTMNISAVTFEEIEGDDNGWWLYAINGSAGSIAVRTMKCELLGSQDDNLGAVYLRDQPRARFGSINVFVAGSGRTPATTAAVEVERTFSPIRTPVYIDAFDMTNTPEYPLAFKETVQGVVRRTARPGEANGWLLNLGNDFGSFMTEPHEFGIANRRDNEIFIDDFRGDVPDPARWDISTGVAASITKAPDRPSVLVFTTGAEAGLTPALNGVMMTGAALDWFAAGQAFMDALIRPKDVTDLAIFIGFIDMMASAGPIMPFTATAGTVAKHAGITNGCGVLFDPAATNAGSWLRVGSNDGTVHNGGAEDPVAGAFDPVIDTDQLVKVRPFAQHFYLYINEQFVSFTADMQDVASVLTPCIAIDTRAEAAVALEIDTVTLHQERL